MTQRPRWFRATAIYSNPDSSDPTNGRVVVKLETFDRFGLDKVRSWRTPITPGKMAEMHVWLRLERAARFFPSVKQDLEVHNSVCKARGFAPLLTD